MRAFALPRPLAIRRVKARTGGRKASQCLGRRGIAALEFAVAAPVVLVLLAMAVDFGMMLRIRITMASGLTNAVQYANLGGATTTSANLSAVLRNATGLNGLAVNVTGPALYCPSGSPVTLAPLTSGTNCAGGAPANTYVIMSTSYTYVPMMPGLDHLVRTTLAQTATAMVK